MLLIATTIVLTGITSFVLGAVAYRYAIHLPAQARMEKIIKQYHRVLTITVESLIKRAESDVDALLKDEHGNVVSPLQIKRGNF